MSNKPTHKVCITEENNGKTFFTDIGSAWLKETGTISVELRPGLAVSGRFVLVTNKEKSKDGAEQAD